MEGMSPYLPLLVGFLGAFLVGLAVILTPPPRSSPLALVGLILIGFAAVVYLLALAGVAVLA